MGWVGGYGGEFGCVGALCGFIATSEEQEIDTDTVRERNGAVFWDAPGAGLLGRRLAPAECAVPPKLCPRQRLGPQPVTRPTLRALHPLCHRCATLD